MVRYIFCNIRSNIINNIILCLQHSTSLLQIHLITSGAYPSHNHHSGRNFVKDQLYLAVLYFLTANPPSPHFRIKLLKSLNNIPPSEIWFFECSWLISESHSSIPSSFTGKLLSSETKESGFKQFYTIIKVTLSNNHILEKILLFHG